MSKQNYCREIDLKCNAIIMHTRIDLKNERVILERWIPIFSEKIKVQKVIWLLDELMEMLNDIIEKIGKFL